MARIPEEEIERIKRETDLKALVESYGVKLEARGKDFFGLCPFHDDHEPSLVVTPEKNLWNCLGACRSGGTVIDWVMKMENVSFRHAVEKLRGGRPETAGRRPETAKEEKPFPAELETGVLLRRVTEFYHETLKESPEALSYLEKRKLIHPELLDCFKLGFSNRTLGYLLPDKQLKAGREIRERFQEIGIMRESGHEHFSG